MLGHNLVPWEVRQGKAESKLGKAGLVGLGARHRQIPFQYLGQHSGS